jgi:protein-S-isoprenylcysteine O-methyltransferase Ste14
VRLGAAVRPRREWSLPISLPLEYACLMIYAIIAAASWLLFIAFWLVNAPKAKKDTTRQGSLVAAVALRVVIIAAAIVLLRVPGGRQLLQRSRAMFSYSNPPFGIAGASLCVVGVVTSVWARACLGANWSSRPALKADHVLVTSGPYRLIRHPIYAGMLLSALGTAIDAGIIGLVIFVVIAAALVRRIQVEEKLMMGLFQEQYALYKRRTKALIPFIV